MSDLDGSHTLEIEAPIERVFAIAADVGRAPEWQGTMKSADVRERDEEGRPTFVETQIDASLATVTLCLRFSYDQPERMSWERASGDLKALDGSWTFERLGPERTRATYALDIGLPRALSMLAKTVRGPAREKVRQLLAERPVEGLKREAEAA